LLRDELIPDENRCMLLKQYYAMNDALLSSILGLPHGPQRSAICREHNLDVAIVRTMLDYSRYFEASNIEKQLVIQRESIRGLRVLDFGCLVSDYGLYYARRGASVAIYDHDNAVNFAAFRFRRENLHPTIHRIPTAPDVLFRDRDLVVFGEVLEHLDDTLEIADACIRHDISYIFTSYYPYGGDRYFALPGHSKLAQGQQHKFIELMATHYSPIVTHDRARLWIRKRLSY
jgi:hypothetical protein